MKLMPCKKPSGKLVAIDTPLCVKGQLFQSYRKDMGNDCEYCEYYEHNQTKDTWNHLVKGN